MRYLILCSILLISTGYQPKQDGNLVVDLVGSWKFTIGDNPRWKAPDLDDSSWEVIYAPTPWENEGFSGFDGFAWYRTTFRLPAKASGSLYLELGYIDDVDEVYVNGQLIGFTGSFPPNFYTAYNALRRYYLPPGVLNKEGENVIAIRVYDTVLEGGLIKGNLGIYQYHSNSIRTMPLGGIWSFKEGDNQYWKEPNYNDDTWEKIMVPSFWRSLKDKNMQSGTAWYRKEFTLPQYLRDEKDLALVLGRIDDFDETYLNGILIGTTNDGRGFGWSFSYQEYRVYNIPEGALNRDGENLISVRVRDIGGNAGIYEGPLGIVPKGQSSRLINLR